MIWRDTHRSCDDRRRQTRHVRSGDDCVAQLRPFTRGVAGRLCTGSPACKPSSAPRRMTAQRSLHGLEVRCAQSDGASWFSLFCLSAHATQCRGPRRTKRCSPTSFSKQPVPSACAAASSWCSTGKDAHGALRARLCNEVADLTVEPAPASFCLAVLVSFSVWGIFAVWSFTATKALESERRREAGGGAAG
jgi:hypothetical protein